MIIGLIGQKRVGKDTVAIIIQELQPSFAKYALADPIKDIARIMFGFTEPQLFDNDKDKLDSYWNIKPREFFERFGTDIMQFDIYNYLPALESRVPKRCFWVHSLLKKLKSSNGSEDGNVIITDIRGTHELEAIKTRYPSAKFIKITRPQYSHSEQEANVGIHITQLEPEMIPSNLIDYSVINDGTMDELKEKVKNILSSISSISNISND